MGRELKRVALDFNWPHNKVWQGFINPHGARSPELHRDLNGSETRGAGRKRLSGH